MEEFLILLLIILIIVVIIIPIASWIKLMTVGSRINELERELKQLKDIGNNITRILADGTRVAAKTETEPSPIQTQQPETIFEEVDVPVVIVEEDSIPDVVSEPEEEFQEDTQETVETPPVFAVPGVDDETLTTATPSPIRKKVKKETAPYRFENLLSKIGIVTLVLGIAFFVKYAIDKDWINEVGRVAIGVLTGGILIGIAHKLREKYNVFSALMVGGGISVLYITITLAFREYHLFDQTLAFIILIAITIFSVILSLVYDRKELALFSLLGGYASPLMISTGEGNYVVLFSFLLILNSGMLLISMRKKWGIIGIVSFVCTQLFYWAWLLDSFKDQYTGALVFAALFFVQFYLLALFDHFLSGRKISPFQVAMILANNLSMFAASIYIFNGTEMKVQGLITISMAIMNAIVMIGLFRKATVDKRLIYLIIAIVLSFVSLAIPVQLNGHVITMFWASEIVILLWMWNKSGIKVFHVGFLLISALTLISYVMDASHIYFDMNDQLPVVFNRIFMTGLVVTAAFVISKLMLTRMNSNQTGIIDFAVLKRILTSIILGMSYIVPFLEIYYQFESSPVEGISGFTAMILGVYTTIYVAVLGIIYRKSIQDGNGQLVALFFFIVLYLAFALPVMIDLRWDVFYEGKHQTLFLIHYLSLPALAYIFYIMVGGIRKLSKQVYAVCGWLLVAFAVVILSVELDNTILQLWGTMDNYDDLLFDVHTFGYPILWGLLAMILMIWGLKVKEALLRQISLGFFAFIILKFYISDIWLMSQTGRIISFVVLGVILLLVSFLIQKIKVLIKDDESQDASL
ncbi:DUF2339 domain-containing protein [Bacteroides sp. 51]|uniref:DUF2339 domain-containing protein n=1 Tax=Bacteroides sp. 51 TaxID=2302938 RepID=UPI0013D3A12A|nr:DUF2339 domain-containing protein [Bacteroides sp. 51]NDV81814.1 DUF2339 domain-containing protein [Bacteroides sp. 51]